MTGLKDYIILVILLEANDPHSRYVYLNPEGVTTKGEDGLTRKSPGLFTMIEAYHAYDQSLLDDPRFGRLPSGLQKVFATGLDAL